MTEKPLEDRAAQSALTGPHETFCRRRLLKVLAGTGGAVAAWGLLPGQWTRPVVEAGMLPKNFQASPQGQSTLTITQVMAQLNGAGQYAAAVIFVDQLCQIDDSAKLSLSTQPCGTIFSGQTLTALKISNSLVRNGDACTGGIRFTFATDPSCIVRTLSVEIVVTGRSASDIYTFPI